MYFVTVVHMFWFSNINFIILLCIINFYSFFLVFHSIYNKYKKGNNRARRHMLRYHRWTDMSWCFFIFFLFVFQTHAHTRISIFHVESSQSTNHFHVLAQSEVFSCYYFFFLLFRVMMYGKMMRYNVSI